MKQTKLIFLDTCAIIPYIKDLSSLTNGEKKQRKILSEFIKQHVQNKNKDKNIYKLCYSSITRAELSLTYKISTQKWTLITELFMSYSFDDRCANSFYEIDKKNNGLNAFKNKTEKCRRDIKTDWEILATAYRNEASIFLTEDKELKKISLPNSSKMSIYDYDALSKLIEQYNLPFSE